MREQLQTLKIFFKNSNITRSKVEVISAIFLVICGLTVLTAERKSKQVLTYNHGQIKYSGYVVNNKMNGEGQLTFENGDSYQGHFTNGQFDGKGTFKASNGWSYRGDFKKGQADGKGVLKAKNNKVYKGTFKQGIFQK
ncbi:MORN repeat-containing protein [Streptococcus uberis]|uniref:hypothetical protein n=1 Tax=Streptococcus uberis TaxID=1349 RepID=UPI003892A9FC